ncbi:MAG: peptidoglycan DD-metalloendopeptidase family protein [Burkholderiaceae bacterium]|jgi:lipoprotein NlpD|nr:peptidoglycan DD-metalloendopeptidase family protein [Burkholderiaceae bacterium]
MQKTKRRTSWFHPILLAAVAALSACTTTSVTRAPVEDRSAADVVRPGVDPLTLPGAENAGKPGYYTVRPGDTIMKIATEANQPWREVVRWNNLGDANVIEVGQVLRIVPPHGSAPPSPPPAPVTVRAAPTAPTASVATPVATQTTPDVSSSQPSSPPSPADAESMSFAWPARGSVVADYDEAKSYKGIAIAGKAGDPVYAAADGRVIYAGAGLPGYGNLLIVQHNTTFMTAYAHNQTLLVKEDQTVKKGQKIAEMGSTGADRVQLHFEIRRSGKPVDPVRYLPAK